MKYRIKIIISNADGQPPVWSRTFYWFESDTECKTCVKANATQYDQANGNEKIEDLKEHYSFGGEKTVFELEAVPSVMPDNTLMDD